MRSKPTTLPTRTFARAFAFALVLGVVLGLGLGVATIGCGPKDNGGGNTNDANCGNGVLDTGEVCDGDELGGMTCTSISGYIGGTLGCQAGCQLFDISECIPENCGNGTLDTNEVCDGANLGGASCQSLGYTLGTLACSDACPNRLTRDVHADLLLRDKRNSSALGPPTCGSEDCRSDCRPKLQVLPPACRTI